MDRNSRTSLGKAKNRKGCCVCNRRGPAFIQYVYSYDEPIQERYPEVKIQDVPGISSINGAASRLGIPLADGDEHVAIVPAQG